MENKISREKLIEDIRQFNELVEFSHPDPYLKCGGKITYHRRLQQLIKDIPDDGMTAIDFFFHLLSFCALIKDGHTLIEIDNSLLDRQNPGGIPIIFGAVDDQLYVRFVFHEENKTLFGCLLDSIEGVGLEEILKRLENLIPCENRYHALGWLGSNWALLMFEAVLKRLIPEWSSTKNSGKIKVSLRHPDGELRDHLFDPASDLQYPYIRNNQPNHLPPLTNEKLKYIFYHFFDREETNGISTALLRVANMNKYREGFEQVVKGMGLMDFFETAKNVYTEFNQKDAPENFGQVLAGIPSVTEIFTKLFTQMEAEQTEYLIVDLRHNLGGFSVMIQIFTYFLVGFERTVELQKTNEVITKYSPFRDQGSENETEVDNASYIDQVPLLNTDYDFSLDPEFSSEQHERSIREEILRDFEYMPTFYKEFETRKHEAYYRPPKILILTSELTFSSGFNMMTDLYKLGGEIVGVPSGQAGNSCGDIRLFELENSQFEGTVSTRAFTAFADDPKTGKLLKPHHPLTYDKFKAFNFDENSALRFALELITQK